MQIQQQFLALCHLGTDFTPQTAENVHQITRPVFLTIAVILRFAYTKTQHSNTTILDNMSTNNMKEEKEESEPNANKEETVLGETWAAV